jgi:hypothetical protein
LYEELTLPPAGDITAWVGYGEVLQELGHASQALAAYETVLQRAPEREGIRIRCAELAGDLGEIERMRGHLRFLTAMLEKGSDGPGLELRLHVADVLGANGFLDEAVLKYRAILDDLARQPLAKPISGPENPACRVWISMAAAYEGEGLPFEAEQVLREGLQAGNGCRTDLLDALIDLCLAEGQVDEAQIVLDAFAAEPGVGTAENSRLLDLWRLKLLGARGKYGPAIRLARRLRGRIAAASSVRAALAGNDERTSDCRIGLLMARLYLEDDEPAQASYLLRQLDAQGCHQAEAAVLLHMAQQDLNGRSDGEEAAEGMEASRLLKLARWYGEYRQWGRLSVVASEAQNVVPDSLAAVLFSAKTLEKTDQLYEALAAYEKIAIQYPANNRALTATARLLFRTGQLDKGLAWCNGILADNPERADLVLLKARILWAMGRWTDAMDVYAAYLTPPVVEELRHDLEQKGLLPPLAPQNTFWNRITFTEGAIPELAEVVMSISHTISREAEDQKRNVLVVPYFARYQWSMFLADELAARRAVRRREYNHALRLYEHLLEGNKNDESLLFDLAGIYNRLDRSLFESATYATLYQRNPDYPGLAQAMARNRLKRRPRTTIDYGMREDVGWDDYKSRRKQWLQASIKMASQPRHEWEVDAARIRYHSTASEAALWSTRTSVTYRKTLAPGLSFGVGGGMEDVENGQARTMLLHSELLGKIGDRLAGSITYQRDVMDDTIASLTRNIISNDIQAGMTLDLLPRVQVGGQLGYVDYSDNNRRNSYTLWSSYLVLPEPLHLSLRYTYDYENALKANTPGIPGEDGFHPADHPYWSPRDYWLSTFSIYFQHQLDGDTLDRGIPRYYSLRYSLGYDSRDYDLQEFEAGFFMELTDHLIASAAGKALSLKSYQSKEVWLSLIYRW